MDPSLAQDHKMEEISDPNSRVVSYFDKVDTKANRPLSQKHNSEVDAIWEVTSIDTPRSQLNDNGTLQKTRFFTIPEGNGSLNKDLNLAKLNKEKILSLIKAWEDNMKRQSQNSYNKKVANINAWEVAEKARAEARLRSIEEKLEKEKAACVERAKNKVAQVHRVAEEQRALIEANHGKEIVKAEEVAAKCRAFGGRPTRRFPFFS